jgi:hypothetical protein
MPASRVSGLRVTSGGDETLHTGADRLIGFLISHKETAYQTITFKDDSTVILTVYVEPDLLPFYVNFAAAGGSWKGYRFARAW